jgi:hypothetical protein
MRLKNHSCRQSKFDHLIELRGEWWVGMRKLHLVAGELGIKDRKHVGKSPIPPP